MIKLNEAERTEAEIRKLARRVAVASERKNRYEAIRAEAAAALLPLIGDRTIAVNVRGVVFSVAAHESWAYPMKADTEQPKRRKHFVTAKKSGEA